jgi:hypothetical protein
MTSRVIRKLGKNLPKFWKRVAKTVAKSKNVKTPTAKTTFEPSKIYNKQLFFETVY